MYFKRVCGCWCGIINIIVSCNFVWDIKTRGKNMTLVLIIITAIVMLLAIAAGWIDDNHPDWM